MKRTPAEDPGKASSIELDGLNSCFVGLLLNAWKMSRLDENAAALAAQRPIMVSVADFVIRVCGLRWHNPGFVPF